MDKTEAEWDGMTEGEYGNAPMAVVMKTRAARAFRHGEDGWEAIHVCCVHIFPRTECLKVERRGRNNPMVPARRRWCVGGHGCVAKVLTGELETLQLCYFTVDK
ncbi:hypothetical protein MAR_008362 [Mya arenaria]|uniref:Uncharacterized protein n=1 Tax=Mya arenaria TaxID=6604 RepID=A0ABY7E063_MYAAR|nr:hypothetical protein MAR_008362 [Mya arenaria]